MSAYRIISDSEEPFQDRIEAGNLLAQELKSLAGENPLILGIPRGGLIPARQIAHALSGDLDLILAHKLGAPGNPELAMGAIVEGGKVFLDQEVVDYLGESNDYIRVEKENQLKVIEKRSLAYRKILARVAVKDRIVVITDDGAARGLTMQAALWAVRHEKPKHLICALPVAPENTVKKLAQYADEVLCLRCPLDFAALGQFYLSFDQVGDEEVFEILSEEAKRKRVHHGSGR